MTDTTTNPLADLRLRETVDLADRAREVRENLLPELDRRIDAAEDPDGEPLHPDDDARDLRELRETLAGQATACERVVEAFGGESAAFTLRELMAGETARLTDDVAQQAIDVDFERQTASGAPKEGYHKLRTLELSVTDAPEGMPTRRDPEIGGEVYEVKHLPDHVVDYLYRFVVALNDAQSVEGVGDFSDYGLPPAETSSG